MDWGEMARMPAFRARSGRKQRAKRGRNVKMLQSGMQDLQENGPVLGGGEWEGRGGARAEVRGGQRGRLTQNSAPPSLRFRPVRVPW